MKLAILLTLLGGLVLVGCGGSHESTDVGAVAPTTTPSQSAIEITYLEELLSLAEGVAESLGRAAELLQAPATFNGDWSIALATEIIIWQTTAQEARELEPPARFTELNALYIQGFEHLDAAGNLLARRIDDFDASLVAQATEELAVGSEKINEATTLLETLSP